jgi:hypothetical protein
MRKSEQVVEQEFLQIRAKILEIAAFLDRLDPADEIPSAAQSRLELLRQGCELLLDEEGDKAARVQLLFSRQYDAQWRQTMGV